MTLLVLSILVAGCADGSEPQLPAMDSGMETPPVVDTNRTEPEDPLSAAVDWQGALRRGAWVCNAQAGCESVPDQSVYNDAFEQEVPAGNVTQGELGLTWDAVSQITEELVFGFRVYTPACSDCGSRYGAEVVGTSPLTVTLPAGMYVAQGEVLRMWVYGAMIEGDGTTGTYAGLSDDQSFSVAGDLWVQPSG